MTNSCPRVKSRQTEPGNVFAHLSLECQATLLFIQGVVFQHFLRSLLEHEITEGETPTFYPQVLGRDTLTELLVGSSLTIPLGNRVATDAQSERASSLFGPVTPSPSLALPNRFQRWTFQPQSFNQVICFTFGKLFVFTRETLIQHVSVLSDPGPCNGLEFRYHGFLRQS